MDFSLKFPEGYRLNLITEEVYSVQPLKRFYNDKQNEETSLSISVYNTGLQRNWGKHKKKTTKKQTVFT